MKKFAISVLIAMMCVSSVLAADLTFVMVPKGVHPYYEPCFEGFKAAADKYGIKAEYVASQAFEIPLQVEIIENLIARGVNGIAISALDDQPLVPVIQKALDAGIKVLTFDAPAPSSAQLSYIGTNNKNAGYMAGKKVAELLGNKGKIAILQGGLSAPNLNLRREGFEEAIKEAGADIAVVTVEDTQGNFDISVNKTEAILQTYPDINAIFSVSAEGTPSAGTVVNQQGKAGQILVAGFDDLKDTLEGIRNGSIQFCLVQKTFTMGWLSVEKLQAALNGEAIEPEIDTGIVVVTKENIDTYMADMKKEFVQ